MRTAPGWLPAHLLAALNQDAPADSDATVAEAFCQGGPLDELPPGPTLTAFLIKASAPQHPADAGANASAARVPGAVPPFRTEDPGAVLAPQREDPSTVSPHRTEDQGAGRRASPDTRSGGTEDPGAVPPPRTEGTDVPEVTGSCAGPNAGLARVGDNALLGLIRGWRRVASMAAAAELAAVAEFSGRRQAEAKSAGEWDSKAVNAADHEIAAALTLTSRSAGVLIDRAMALRELPATAAALAAGQIDMAKALVFMTGLDGQDPKLARTIEDGLIGRAPAQTTGQLRAALHRALLAADPDAAERRRQAEEKQARVEQMPESGGVTASLAGRHLPVPATVAAWNHITALAGQLRRSGAAGTLDELRVHVYLALLSGQATSGLPRGDAQGSSGTKGSPDTESSPDTAAVADPDVTPAPEGTPSGGTPAPEGTPTPAPGETPAPGGTPPGETPDAAGTPAPGETPDAAGTPAPGETPDAAGTPAPGETPDAAGTAGSEVTDEAAAPERTATATSSPPDAAGSPPGGTGGLTGTVNLTVPLTTLLGLTESPGELGGFGPITAFTARDLAGRTLNAPLVRWCVTVTGKDGEPIGHGCEVRRRPGRDGAACAFTMNISALAGTDCTHARESSHYRPPPSLWHLVQIRSPRCTAPGCRMPAARCDGDHTQPFEEGGRSCECNLGPLCRYHHRVKHSQGWRLEQPEPGVLAWITPSGRKYFTGPAVHAA
jgi:Domain of unknown function (DUF222)